MVESIDRKSRIIRIHNGDVLSSINIMMRYIVYDEDSNTIKQQNEIQRNVDDYDLRNIRPEINHFTFTSFQQDIEHIVKRNKIS